MSLTSCKGKSKSDVNGVSLNQARVKVQWPWGRGGTNWSVTVNIDVFAVSVNETEVAFFRREDYDLYKANPKSAWWRQHFTLQQRRLQKDRGQRSRKRQHYLRRRVLICWLGFTTGVYISALCLFISIFLVVPPPESSTATLVLMLF